MKQKSSSPSRTPTNKGTKAGLTEEQRRQVYAMQTQLIGSEVYRRQLSHISKDTELHEAHLAYVVDLINSIKPRDALEQMLLMQALWTHARLAHLSVLANQQTHTISVKTINEACDRAANTFRRQMLALSEYRSPKHGDTFMAIKQANVAQQQVITHGKNSHPISSNEQGFAPAPALPPHPERTGITARVSSSKQAMAVQHRSEDGSRQSALKKERRSTR